MPTRIDPSLEQLAWPVYNPRANISDSTKKVSVVETARTLTPDTPNTSERGDVVVRVERLVKSYQAEGERVSALENGRAGRTRTLNPLIWNQEL